MMIIYNVTIKIDPEVHDEWLHWMREIHIPDVLETGLFSGHRVCKLLGVETTDGITYAIQYFCKDLAAFEKYQKNYAPELQAVHTDKFKDNFVAFRTLMQVIDP